MNGFWTKLGENYADRISGKTYKKTLFALVAKVFLFAGILVAGWLFLSMFVPSAL